MNTLRNELHLHVKKSGKPSNPYPTSRCRNCTRQGKPGVTTRYVCDSCPQTPGLCSKACFTSFHQGFETMLAARKIHTETAPETPPEPEPASDAVSQPSTVIEAVSSRELPGVDACRRRLEDMHTLIYKPATEKKPKPTLACAECRYKDKNVRKERRTICCKCHTGFCSKTCLQSHHLRLGIFLPPSQPTNEEQPGPSSAQQFDPEGLSHPPVVSPTTTGASVRSHPPTPTGSLPLSPSAPMNRIIQWVIDGNTGPQTPPYQPGTPIGSEVLSSVQDRTPLSEAGSEVLSSAHGRTPEDQVTIRRRSPRKQQSPRKAELPPSSVQEDKDSERTVRKRPRQCSPQASSSAQKAIDSGKKLLNLAKKLRSSKNRTRPSPPDASRQRYSRRSTPARRKADGSYEGLHTSSEDETDC